MDDEEQIRRLIERWATAVHEGDLATVLADHADHGGSTPTARRGRRSAGTSQPRTHCSAAERPRSSPKTDRRLRLTIGRRREGDRWIVAHEHHSFPLG